MRSLQRSAVYFALLEALGKSGCPVCRILEEASASYLDTLFYEQVTDVGMRRKLRRARGLCNWHSWRARNIPTAALGLAIIAQDLLDEECTRLAELQRRPLWRRMGNDLQARLSRQSLLAYLRGWVHRDICPACQAASEHERHALETMLDFAHEAEFARRFETSFGVCLPHLMQAAVTHPFHAGLIALIEVQRRKHARLRAELEEFCRKHDHRYGREAWGEESDAWVRAIEVLAGKPGVLGNDLRRRHTPRRPRLVESLLGWWR